MMNPTLKAVLIGLVLSNPLTHAQTKDTSVDSLTFEYHQRSFQCRFARDAINTLDTLPEESLQSRITQSIQDTESALQEPDLDRHEKHSLNTHLGILRSISREKFAKSEMQKFFNDLCVGTDETLHLIGRGGAHASNVINQAAVFPFRFMFHFFRGLATGEETPRRQITWNEFLGHRMSSTFSIYFLYKGYQLLSQSNPATAALFVTPMIDTITHRVCSRNEELNETEQRFCENFVNTKSAFFQTAAIGQQWGAHIKNNHAQKGQNTDSPSTNTSKTLDEQPSNTDFGKPVNDETLCEYIAWVKSGWKTGEELRVFAKDGALILNPGNFTQPRNETYTIHDQLLRKSPATQMAKLRNVVINLSPPYTELDATEAEPEADGDQVNDANIRLSLKIAKYRRKSKLFRSMKRTLNNLYDAKSVQGCTDKKNENSYSYAEHAKLEEELRTQFVLERFYEQSKGVESAFKKDGSGLKLLHRSRLSWELIRTNTINQLRAILQDPTVGNIVFVGHTRVQSFGKPNGATTVQSLEEMIIDSLGVVIPADFFTKLNPNLMSISFLICHSDTVIKTYHVDQALQSGESVHQKRVLNIVQTNELLDDPAEAPLSGFLDFLQRVDRNLHETLQENMLIQQFGSFPVLDSVESCTLEIPDFRVKKGILALKLNGHLIGTINPGEPGNRFIFDCGYLKKDKVENTLRLYQPISILTEKQQELKAFIFQNRFLLNGKEFNLKNITWTDFKGKDGKYESSTIKFRGNL
jgi:hypothetical protein